MKYRDFIECYFNIDEPKEGKIVPFKFRPIQNKYYDDLLKDYQENRNFAGLREIILKARREGFSSFILALFAADMILSTNPIQYLCLSYKEDATRKLFRRFKLYIESYCHKKGGTFKDFVETDNRHEIQLKENRAYFYIGTASAKVGERGGTVQGIHFAEAAFYPNTDIMTAQEIIDASMRMVDIDAGMVFVESTANGFGNHYKKMWDAAKSGESRFKPRFFSWMDFYSREQYDKIASEFADKRMLAQEYPDTPQAAFLTSGENYFDQAALEFYLDAVKEPIKEKLIYEKIPAIREEVI